MKRSTFQSTKLIKAITTGIAGICTITSMSLLANEVQVSRYSLLSATPTDAQVKLLATTIKVIFPERIQTVGEAIRYLLLRSGYRLASTELLEADTKALFALPLPAVHQSLGPMKLSTALETLAGPTFILIQDPVHRLVSFDSCIEDWNAAQGSAPNINKEIVQDED